MSPMRLKSQFGILIQTTKLESYSTEFAKPFQIKFYFTCYHSDSEWRFEFWRSFDY